MTKSKLNYYFFSVFCITILGFSSVKCVYAQSLEVTAPLGGETFEHGEDIYVNWNSYNSNTRTVRIELYKDGWRYRTLSESRDVYYPLNWVVGDDIPVTNGQANYSIRVISLETSASAFSNSFSVTEAPPPPPPYVNFNSDYNNTQINPGQNFSFNWSSNIGSGYFELDFKYNNTWYSIDDYVESYKRSFNWTVPSWLVGTIQVRIQNSTGPADYTGMIKAGDFTITSPSSGKEYRETDQVSINWSPSNTINRVNLTLYKNGNFYKSLAANTSNDGQFTWTVSNQDASSGGDFYTVKIVDLLDPSNQLTGNVSDKSGKFNLKRNKMSFTTSDGINQIAGSGIQLSWSHNIIKGSLELHYKKGRRWIHLTTLDNTETNYKWTTPYGNDYISSTEVRIRSVKYPSVVDYVKNISLTKDITVTWPAAGDSLQIGKETSVNYNADYPAIEYVGIDLYRNGSKYKNIVHHTTNSSYYPWNISSNLPTTGTFHIEVYEMVNNSGNFTRGSVSATSETFYLWEEPKYLNFSSNYNGIQLTPGQNFRIDWDHNFTSGHFILEYKYNGAWHAIEDVATGSSYGWYPPNSLIGTINLRIRHSSGYTDQADGIKVGDFIINSPSNGQTFWDGDEVSIGWTPHNSINQVGIALNKDGTFYTTLTGNTSNDGQFTWNVTPEEISPEEGFYTLEIYDLLDPNTQLKGEVNDESENFNLEKNRLNFSSDYSGQTFVAGDELDLLWNPNLKDGNVVLEYDNGSGWQHIATKSHTDNFESWTTPSSLSGSTDIRIRSMANSQLIDRINNVNFKQGTLSFISDYAGQDIITGGVLNLNWDVNLKYGSIVLEYNSGSGWENIAVLGSSITSESWNIPTSLSGSTDIRIRSTFYTGATDQIGNVNLLPGQLIFTNQGNLQIPAGEEFDIAWNDNISSGSFELHYRVDGGSWQSLADKDHSSSSHTWTPSVSLEGKTVSLRIRSTDFPHLEDTIGGLQVISAAYSGPGQTVEIVSYDDYSDYGNLLKATDANGNETEYFYGTNNQPLLQSAGGINGAAGVHLTGIRRANGSEPDLTTTAAYNAKGLLSAISNPNEDTTRFGYDGLNRLEAIRNASNDSVSRYQYWYAGSNLSAGSPNYIQSTAFDASGPNRVTTRYLDGLGRAIQIQQQDGNNAVISATTYNALGRPARTYKPYFGDTGQSSGSSPATTGQFYTNFSEYAAGRQPADWTMTWNGEGGGGQAEVKEVTGSTGGKVLRFFNSQNDSNRYLLTWDDLLGEPGTGDFELAVRVRGSAVEYIWNWIALWGRAGGPVTARDGYLFQQASGPEEYQIMELIDGIKTQGEKTEQSQSWVNDEWFFVVFRIEGTTIKAKIWKDGDPEPSFTTNAGVTASELDDGLIGIGGRGDGNLEYDWVGIGLDGKAAPRQPVSPSGGPGSGTDSEGQPTIAGTNPWQVALHSYDDEGRIAEKWIWTGDNTALDTHLGYEYNLQGEITKRKVKVGSDSLYQHYSYSRRGLLDSVFASTGGVKPADPEVTYTYTATGAVDTIDFKGSKDVSYAYTIRDWVESINNIGSPPGNFAAAYNYYDNGNVKTADFHNPDTGPDGAPGRYSYAFDYDNLNRLRQANYNAPGSNAFDVRGVEYDAAGNIRFLSRWDGTGTLIDDLEYEYVAGTNRLEELKDPQGNRHGWDAAPGNFGYDANGNMTSQTGKLSDISYDHRNLPTRFTTESGPELIAGYNAEGQRILKESSSGAWQFYVKDGPQTLGVIKGDGQGETSTHFNLTGNTTFGRWVPGGTRRYYLKDVLGSTRVVVDDQGNVTETRDFYPFGLTMPQRSYSAGTETLEKFTGKERDESIGLDYFGARYYDPALARWHSVDPLASKYPSLSPYNYVTNNPINAFDPDGQDIWFVHGTDSDPSTWYRTSNAIASWERVLNDKIHRQNGVPTGNFAWSGANYPGARTEAARSLARKIAAAKNSDPDMLVQLIAHSHGGNVSIEAANILKEKYNITVDRLVLLGTPSRGDYKINKDSVTDVINVYNRNDLVQILGGFDTPFGVGIKILGGFAGRNRSNNEGAVEINVTVVGSSGSIESHTTIHNTKDLIDYINKALNEEEKNR